MTIRDHRDRSFGKKSKRRMPQNFKMGERVRRHRRLEDEDKIPEVIKCMCCGEFKEEDEFSFDFPIDCPCCLDCVAYAIESVRPDEECSEAED